MKSLGKCAIALAIIFFVFIISGAVMVSVGGVNSLNNLLNSENLPGWVRSIIEFFEDFDLDTEEVTFSNSFEMDEDIAKLVVEDIAFYDISFEYSDTDVITVEFAGDYPVSYIDKYDIYVEPYIEKPEVSDSDTDVTSGSDAVSDSDAAKESKSPIEFKLSDGVLTIELDTPKSGINIDGDITIILPEDMICDITLDSVAGDVDINGISAYCIELNNCFGDISIEGEFTSFIIEKCLGDINLTTDCAVDADCEIVKNLGDIDITIGEDSAFVVERDNNVGDTSIENFEKGDFVISITENVGDINVKAK